MAVTRRAILCLLLLAVVPACKKTRTVFVVSTAADLSGLAVSVGALAPAFDPGTVFYTVRLPETETAVTVTPTAADPAATILVNGTPVASGAPAKAQALNVGINPALVAVTSADATTQKVYSLLIIRGGPAGQEAYVKASNTGPSDNFGTALALSGDTLVVTATFESSAATGVDGNEADDTAAGAGAAYVFVRSGSVWTQQAYLKASNTGAGDNFGKSVAIDGDTIVVGADFEQSNATGVNGNEADDSLSSAGAAYVFVRSGTVWSQQAYLKASNTDSSDRFGASVAVDGDTVVVGAWGEASNAVGVNGNDADNSAPTAGAAYVFVRSGTVWSQQAYLKASNTEQGDIFGGRVDLSGDTAVVGAPFEDSNATGVDGDGSDNSALNAGAAYVFVRVGTVWAQEAYLKASNTGAGDNLAFVGIDGDTIVAGAPFEASNAVGVDGDGSDDSAYGAGAAYVFTRTGGVWTQEAYLKASNTEGLDEFGWATAVSGDTIVVGAGQEDSVATGLNGDGSDNAAAGAGAAYVFVRNGGVWVESTYLKASNTDAGDSFGARSAILAFGVAVDADTVAVGAVDEDSSATGVGGNELDNGTLMSGAAYVFR